MLKRLTPREQFELLVAKWEPAIRAAFMEAIDDIRSNIVLRRIVERLERGDIGGAIQAMNLDEAAFRPLDEAIRQAFNAGGVGEVQQMPALRGPDGYQVIVRFDVRNIFAEAWLREHSGTLISRIVEDQLASIREKMVEGLARGDNPTRTALDIIGRVGATGVRTGGILGLTGQQAKWVATARQDLLSGDPARLRHYLTLGQRDKRFDKTVLNAIREGKALPADMVAKITGRLADGYLKLRGDTIALNETFAALNESKMQAWRQAVAKGDVDVSVVTKEWKSMGDGRVRHTHRAMHGQKVPFEAKFVSPSGAQLAYPHDPAAPTAETLGCRCRINVTVDYVQQLINRRG